MFFINSLCYCTAAQRTATAAFRCGLLRSTNRRQPLAGDGGSTTENSFTSTSTITGNPGKPSMVMSWSFSTFPDQFKVPVVAALSGLAVFGVSASATGWAVGLPGAGDAAA